MFLALNWNHACYTLIFLLWIMNHESWIVYGFNFKLTVIHSLFDTRLWFIHQARPIHGCVNSEWFSSSCMIYGVLSCLIYGVLSSLNHDIVCLIYSFYCLIDKDYVNFDLYDTIIISYRELTFFICLILFRPVSSIMMYIFITSYKIFSIGFIWQNKKLCYIS